MKNILQPKIKIGTMNDDFANGLITVIIYVHKTKIVELSDLDLWRISHFLKRKNFITEYSPGIYKYRLSGL